MAPPCLRMFEMRSALLWRKLASSSSRRTAEASTVLEGKAGREQAFAMITGARTREARLLLGLEASALAKRPKLPSSVISRAESIDGEPTITIAQARAIQHALEKAGVEFTNGSQPGVSLKAHQGGRT